ncbi:hypothetical protein [Georgenia yuyongxinii]|uniref:Uncharacterized protein n=1 Tax=Georgenia yuyongxinii TaxID=2589797 RepID=A0A552WW41_9MICO|nr:hypothetical protein [Georgenia yuyongxinii]TRW46523.1 hypothetical protein FJ693_05255 [Georgenia yuyongxinii]
MSRARRSPPAPLERPPRPPGRVLDAHLHLLDRQVLDVDGVPVCTVDDIEVLGAGLGEPGTGAGRGGPGQGADNSENDGAAYVAALLTGPVLGTRIFGGSPPADRWKRIPWSDVADVGTALRLGVRGEHLDVTWQERWFRDHVIARIPGGRRAAD